MSRTILVTGSAGFIGTNLIERKLAEGHSVLGLDNFSSSNPNKAKLYTSNPNYDFVEYDVVNDIFAAVAKSKFKGVKFDEVYNLACPASPPRYMKLPLETIAVNVTGTINALEFAKAHGASLLHTSTSEIYGDPEVHPQPESYRGNVNTIGPRSCYDEGKRISETICYEYHKLFGVDIKLVRLFNTYGPHMDPDDGRVVSNFILQALRGEDITIYGTGSQTRSFQYVHDLLNAFDVLMQTTTKFEALNLGNPDEFTIKELAEIVLSKVSSSSKIVYKDLPQDDPKQRKPEISKAREILKWSPNVKLEHGLDKTIEYFKQFA